MRKTCAKPVDTAVKSCVSEPKLYSAFAPRQLHTINYPRPHPHKPQTPPTAFSTAFQAQLHLLSGQFSTLYTGLITNTTKYINL